MISTTIQGGGRARGFSPGNALATYRAQGLAVGCPTGQTRQNERGLSPENLRA